MNYKIRLLNEMLELQIKITRLESFLKNTVKDPTKAGLSLEEKQLKIMKDYMDILYQRMLNALNEPSEDTCVQSGTIVNF